MFKTLLVATDGSRHAHKAVELASDLAEKYGARMILLHVIHERVSESLQRMAEIEYGAEIAAASALPNQKAAIYEALQDLGRRILEQAEQVARGKGVKNISKVVEEGDAVKRILEQAERTQADLIVLGSRGLSDLKGLLQGSVSHKVSQLALCTCVTVK